MFPEGVAQSSGHGFINDYTVKHVQRFTTRYVWHFIESASSFEIGQSVDVRVDWKRRCDYIQQHSSNYLLSAVEKQELGLETVGWSLIRKNQHYYVHLQISKNLKD